MSMKIYLLILLMCGGCLTAEKKADAQDVTKILELQLKELNQPRDWHDSAGKTVAKAAFDGFDRSSGAVLLIDKAGTRKKVALNQLDATSLRATGMVASRFIELGRRYKFELSSERELHSENWQRIIATSKAEKETMALKIASLKKQLAKAGTELEKLQHDRTKE
ncbi:MAG: hypothetical protein P8I27_10970 [Pirellulaceae bacterium]|nr:hypothetical protein [Pirellulaceae bacterium]